LANFGVIHSIHMRVRRGKAKAKDGIQNCEFVSIYIYIQNGDSVSKKNIVSFIGLFCKRDL
jgi:hypothetical protein